MNAVIVSSRAAEHVLKAIGHSDISYEKTGKFEGSEFLEYIQAVSRIHIQTLITDLDCTDMLIFMQGIRQYRMLRSSTRIIVIALDRHEEDGMVHQLAELGAQVITTSPGTKAETITHALLKLMPESAKSADIAADMEAEGIQMDRIKDQIYRFTSKLHSTYLEGADVLDMELPDLPFQERVVVQERIVGTITIAVMGVESKIGSTHLSILMANYLNRKGYSVALLEANGSQDFAYIESAYEGIRDFTNSTSQFSINGVMYYKHNSKVDMSSLLAMGYDYLILDIGSQGESDWSQEFFRANAQILLGAGSEWRQPKIKQFRKMYSKMDQSNWYYCIPFVDPISITDIRKELPGNQVFRLPPHPDPYKTSSETDAALTKILKPYLGVRKKASTKIWFYSILSGCIVIIIALIILLILK